MALTTEESFSYLKKQEQCRRKILGCSEGLAGRKKSDPVLLLALPVAPCEDLKGKPGERRV
ncbi:hypothetical protein EBZ02_03250 [bacterium]|nr:hypothetical protein [bacterium]NDA10200.1 hypothetical protein [Verrucomicrobiota bacterium]